MLSEMLISFLFVINVTVVNFLSPKNASESFLVISYIIKYYPNLLKHTKYSINKDDHFQHYFTLFLRKTVMEYYREFVKE